MDILFVCLFVCLFAISELTAYTMKQQRGRVVCVRKTVTMALATK